jgi:hypothetical protein
MKKAMLASALILTLFGSGCKKEDPSENSQSQPCNCGVITSDGIDSQTDCYWLEIENDCSGHRKKFCFSYDVWFNNYVGDRFCVTNVTSW